MAVPLWLQAGTYPASADRRLLGALWPAGAVSGMPVTAVGGQMRVSVAAGQAAVPTQNNSGSTLCTNDAPVQVTLPAAPASGSNRIDLIIVRPRGNDLDGGSNTDWIFDFVSSAVVASPVVPATPAGTLALASVYVGGGVAAIVAGNITDMRPGPLNVGGSQPTKSPLGLIASTVGPSIQTDTQAEIAVASVTFTATAGRRYRFTAMASGTIITAAATSPRSRLLVASGPIVFDLGTNTWITAVSSLAINNILVGTGVHMASASTTGPTTVNLTASNAGASSAYRFAPNSCQLTVEDMGTP